MEMANGVINLYLRIVGFMKGYMWPYI